MKSLRRVAGLCMVSFGTAFAVFLFGVDADARDEGETTPLRGGSGEAPVVVSEIPSGAPVVLPAQEASRVREAVSRSAVVRDAIGRATFTIGDAALWTDELGQFLGGVAVVQLDHPITLRRGFPALAPAPRDANGRRQPRLGDNAIVTEPAPFDALDVSQVNAFVDLRGEPRVVALSPPPSAQTVWDPSYLAGRPPVIEGGE